MTTDELASKIVSYWPLALFMIYKIYQARRGHGNNSGPAPGADQTHMGGFSRLTHFDLKDPQRSLRRVMQVPPKSRRDVVPGADNRRKDGDAFGDSRESGEVRTPGTGGFKDAKPVGSGDTSKKGGTFHDLRILRMLPC